MDCSAQQAQSLEIKPISMSPQDLLNWIELNYILIIQNKESIGKSIFEHSLTSSSIPINPPLSPANPPTPILCPPRTQSSSPSSRAPTTYAPLSTFNLNSKLSAPSAFRTAILPLQLTASWTRSTRSRPPPPLPYPPRTDLGISGQGGWKISELLCCFMSKNFDFGL